MKLTYCNVMLALILIVSVITLALVAKKDKEGFSSASCSIPQGPDGLKCINSYLENVKTSEGFDSGVKTPDLLLFLNDVEDCKAKFGEHTPGEADCFIQAKRSFKAKTGYSVPAGFR